MKSVFFYKLQFYCFITILHNNFFNMVELASIFYLHKLQFVNVKRQRNFRRGTFSVIDWGFAMNIVFVCVCVCVCARARSIQDEVLSEIIPTVLESKDIF